MVQFARSHIISHEQLQVFLACIDNRERWWDSTSMARELGISEAAARRALDRLASGNLLDIRLTDEVHYRFRPGSEELEARASSFAAAFRRNPAAVVQLVGRLTIDETLRDFANAFRIRRDDHR